MLLLWVAWAALASIWGTTWIAINVGLETIPPVTYAGIRFLLGGIVLGGVVAVRRIPLPATRTQWKLILWTGLQIFFLGYALQFWGMQFVPSGLSAVVFSAVPLLTMFVAHFRLHNERITLQKVIGSLVALGGVALISREQLHAESPFAIWGIAAFVTASLIYSNAQVTLKAEGGDVDPNVMATFQMLAGGVSLLVVGALVEGNPANIEWTTRSLSALAYLSLIGSSLAFFLLYWLLPRMEVTKLMSVLLVDPVIALLLGFSLLGETLRTGEVIGSSLALIGLAAVLMAGGGGKRRQA